METGPVPFPLKVPTCVVCHAPLTMCKTCGTGPRQVRISYSVKGTEKGRGKGVHTSSKCQSMARSSNWGEGEGCGVGVGGTGVKGWE